MKKIRLEKDLFNKEEKSSFAQFLKKIGMVSSSSEGLRMIEQGAVTFFIDDKYQE